jgi:two-component system nitrogen regulation sensor histidine kinase GlnL
MASEPVKTAADTARPRLAALESPPGEGGPDARAQVCALVFALLLVAPDGTVTEVNNAAETLLGTSAKKILGQPLVDLVAPLGQRVASLMVAGDAALVARHVRVVFADAEEPVNLTVSPIADHPGWRVVTISQLGQERNQREELTTPLVGAPSILAHEIKNPLAAIKGASQLIARKLPHGDKPLARMIADEVDRIARLVDRMQQLGSQIAEEGAPCNPHEAIRAALATVRTAGMEGVEIVEEFDPSLPAVLANRDALVQVLINLVSNARDAAASRPRVAGGQEPRITIRTRYVSGQVFSALRRGRSVRLPIEICITDNGAGVPPELRDRLFEPFVSSKPSGQGLGLALVRKLVRDMDGSISHERDGAEGLTHFRLHLPKAPRP